jgi:hypothetical protein
MYVLAKKYALLLVYFKPKPENLRRVLITGNIND